MEINVNLFKKYTIKMIRYINLRRIVLKYIFPLKWKKYIFSRIPGSYRIYI